MPFTILAALAAQALPVAAKPAPDPAKPICRSQPILGSRLKQKKTCKTAAEWKAEDADADQLRRDLNNVARPNPGD